MFTEHIEVQEPHWHSLCITILVHITYRLNQNENLDVIETWLLKKIHFYISNDGKHDTSFLQHCLFLHWWYMTNGGSYTNTTSCMVWRMCRAIHIYLTFLFCLSIPWDYWGLWDVLVRLWDRSWEGRTWWGKCSGEVGVMGKTTKCKWAFNAKCIRCSFSSSSQD
jgi:hypothetical protein